MMRSSAWFELLACSVARQRWPGFGERQGVVHGFAVANLADEDDVRRLTQGVFQRGKPVFGIHADFALGNDAFFV